MAARTQDQRVLLSISAICYVAFLTTSVSSQELSTGRLVTFKQILQEHKIELTEDSLVSALRNPDSHTRYLAALVLAEDKAKNAVPAITEALGKENNPETYVNMALALAQLGSDRGTNSLKEACTDVHLTPTFRVYAVKYLLDLGKESCLNSTLVLLRSETDPGVKVLALSQLPRFQNVSAADSQAILGSVLAALSDQEPLVRIAASHALVPLRELSAVPRLEQAIAAEHDEGTRSILAGDLSQLRQNNRSRKPAEIVSKCTNQTT